MRKILAVSDMPVAELSRAFRPDLVAGVEMIFSCGDLPPEYLALLRQRVEVPLYTVPGNHDLRYHQALPDGCLDMHGRFLRANGLRILGLGGCRWYNGGVFQYHESEMMRLLLRLWPRLLLAGGVDIVFTHAPPRHIHDAEDRCHRGFRCFRALIRRRRPALFLHGHVHGLFSTDKERETLYCGTRVINCCGHVVVEC